MRLIDVLRIEKNIEKKRKYKVDINYLETKRAYVLDLYLFCLIIQSIFNLL